MALSAIRQRNEVEEARRRRRYPEPPAPAPEALAIGPGPAPGRKPSRRRVARCRCLDGSIIEIEEGARCPPGCNAITQGEAEEEEVEGGPLVPFLIIASFFGLMIFAISKRPFG